jgi:hypothetical protein
LRPLIGVIQKYPVMALFQDIASEQFHLKKMGGSDAMESSIFACKNITGRQWARFKNIDWKPEYKLGIIKEKHSKGKN